MAFIRPHLCVNGFGAALFVNVAYSNVMATVAARAPCTASRCLSTGLSNFCSALSDFCLLVRSLAVALSLSLWKPIGFSIFHWIVAVSDSFPGPIDESSSFLPLQRMERSERFNSWAIFSPFLPAIDFCDSVPFKTNQFNCNPMKLSRGYSLKKIFVHSPPPPKKKKSKKSKDFFEDLKSVHLIWEWTTPRIHCLNPFLFIKSSYTKKKFEKSWKSKKSPQKP